MSSHHPNISGSEWTVASIVWAQDGRTAAEIVENLPAGAKWKLKTVNTFLTRLVGKGVISARRDGRAFRYYTVIPREQCVRAESESFLRRIFDGALAPMLAHFCETTNLSDDEIAELRRILNKKGAAKKKGRSPREM